MSSVYERITSALSSLGKRARDSSAAEGDGAGAGSAAGGGPTSPGGGGAAARTPKRFRPWEQADLHKRLETYKPLTWFGKPASVGAVPCALKGWVNDGSDSLTCEYCGSKLRYPPHVAYDQRQAAADMFSPALTTKHTATCPWRQTASPPKLLAYVPSSSPEQLCSLFYSLNDKLMRVDVLPDMDTLAIQTLRSTAMPYGSYDDFITAGGPGGGAVIVGGAAGGGAAAHGYGGYSRDQDLAPRRRKMPSVTIRELDDNGDEVMTPTGSAAGAGGLAVAAAAAAGGGDPASMLQALAAAGDAGEGQAVLVQTSKLAPAQKARLLALLGWDVDVLQPDSASGMAVAPYAAGGSYSLNHLGVKPKGAAAAAAGGGGAGGGGGGADGKGGKKAAKVPSSQVVLKCPICHSRMGLWNYSGVRPVPVGRLTAPPPPAAGGAAALMLSPRPGGASSGGAGGAGAFPAAPAAVGSDPLSCTIAGGQYGQFGFGGGAAAAKPFGSAAAAAPFRFGSAASAAPVFGMAAAMETDAQRGASASGGSGLFGSTAAAAAAAATPSAAAPAAGSATPTPAGGLAGRKRKAEAPEAMAVDAPSAPSAGMATPVAAPDGKRQRMATTPLWGGAGFGAIGGPASPGGLGHGGASAAAGAAAGQPRELDPVAQHRSWCPWVYTGSGDEKHMSGWQHMLSALQQQQQQQATPGAAGAPGPADGRQLRDNALEAIRKL